MLLYSMMRFFKFLPEGQRQQFLSCLDQKASMTGILPKRPRLRLGPNSYMQLCRQVMKRDGWKCQVCGSSHNLQVHHKQLRSHQGSDEDSNLITLCAECHEGLHNGHDEICGPRK